MMPDEGTFLTAKKITIDGLACAELSYILKSNSVAGELHIYVLQYSLFYKNKLIMISFAAGDLTLDGVKILLNKYQGVFKGIMNSFVLLNQWES